MASVFKASFHPAGGDHQSAAWTFGFTKESEQRFTDLGSRRGKTWPQQPSFKPGWHRGPKITVPRLPDRAYDLPPIAAEFRGAPDTHWVVAPEPGHAAFLMVSLSDDRADLPPLVVGGTETVVGTLPMANGWHLSLISNTRALREDELRPVYAIRDDLKVDIDETPRPGSTSGAIIWVTESPDGPPMFVHIVLGSDNFRERKAN